jgi:stringent starvation protein B
MSQDSKVTSQQPYFLRALYEWCVDNGYTPHVTVRVDGRAKVPVAYVKDGQIVLNIGPSAVRGLVMDNEWLTFSARFGGVAQEISVPVENVLAVYARETGEGMAFSQTVSATAQAAAEPGQADGQQDEQAPEPGPDRPKGRPTLRVVK